MQSSFSDPQEPVFTAADMVAYQRARGLLPQVMPPRSVVIVYNQRLVDQVRRKYSGRKARIFNAELFLLKKTDYQVGVISGFGAGSSATAALVDQLCAFGVGQFMSIGLAGGLQPSQNQGDLVISQSAIRDEGVSRHYLAPAETADSSEEMAAGLGAVLTRQTQTYSTGVTWTTDAPFRETRKDVLNHQGKGVLAVDMEAAAIFSVAQANGASALAAFSIADTLANGIWHLPDDLRPAQKGLTVLFDAAFEYLNKGRRV